MLKYSWILSLWFVFWKKYNAKELSKYAAWSPGGENITHGLRNAHKYIAYIHKYIATV